MLARLSGHYQRTLILMMVLIVAGLALDLWQSAAQRAGGHAWLDGAIGVIAAPLQGAIAASRRWTLRQWQIVAENRRLVEENARLRVQVADLQTRMTRLEEEHARAERVEALRAAYAELDLPAQLATVIGVGAGGWLSYLVLDRGQADGIRPRDVVVTGEGVVGQVYAVSEQTARVLPISDPASGVAVRVQRSRETGVLKGVGEWQCELRYLAPEAEVQPGDRLLTAGTGGVFPRGLHVGVVTQVREDPQMPGKVAAVKLAADLRNLEEVLVLRAADWQEGGRSVPHRDAG